MLIHLLNCHWRRIQTTPSYQECNFNISPDVDEFVRVQTVLCASAFKSGFALSMKLSIFFRERFFLTTMTSNYCHYHLWSSLGPLNRWTFRIFHENSLDCQGMILRAPKRTTRTRWRDAIDFGGGNWSDRDVAARARCLTVSVAGNDDERHVDREIENWNNFAMTWFRAAGEEIAGKIWWICVFGTQKFSTSLGCSMSCCLGSHSWTVQYVESEILHGLAVAFCDTLDPCKVVLLSLLLQLFVFEWNKELCNLI